EERSAPWVGPRRCLDGVGNSRLVRGLWIVLPVLGHQIDEAEAVGRVDIHACVEFGIRVHLLILGRQRNELAVPVPVVPRMMNPMIRIGAMDTVLRKQKMGTIRRIQYQMIIGGCGAQLESVRKLFERKPARSAAPPEDVVTITSHPGKDETRLIVAV